MLDNRIYTFLELCNVMNYHKTAENLNLTQPAVTHHIKFLEERYNCKLFNYSNRKLTKTDKCIALEKYIREIISLDLYIKDELLKKDRIQINIGTTKTIGEYVISPAIISLISQNNYDINLIVDNTEKLLNKLNHFELDLLLLEGYIDKDKYLFTKLSDEELVGICSINHEFANKEIQLKDVLNQNLVIREKGSGTRNVFENFLTEQGYNINDFKNKSVINNNKIIEQVVENTSAISFVYKIMQENNPNIAYFKISNKAIYHEFNAVFLNNIKGEKILNLIKTDITINNKYL